MNILKTVIFLDPRNEALVTEAEAILGLEFPPTDKELVRSLGVGDIAGIEFYGIIENTIDHSTIPDAI